jgi:hypothetical protein
MKETDNNAGINDRNYRRVRVETTMITMPPAISVSNYDYNRAARPEGEALLYG